MSDDQSELNTLGYPTISESIRFFPENPYVTQYLTIDGRDLTCIYYWDPGCPDDEWFEGDPPMMELYRVEFNDEDITDQIRGTPLEDEIMEAFDLSEWEP